MQTFMAGAVAVESVTPFYFRDLNEMETLLVINELMEQLKGFLEHHGLENLDSLYQTRKNRGFS